MRGNDQFGGYDRNGGKLVWKLWILNLWEIASRRGILEALGLRVHDPRDFYVYVQAQGGRRLQMWQVTQLAWQVVLVTFQPLHAVLCWFQSIIL